MLLLIGLCLVAWVASSRTLHVNEKAVPVNIRQSIPRHLKAAKQRVPSQDGWPKNMALERSRRFYVKLPQEFSRVYVTDVPVNRYGVRFVDFGANQYFLFVDLAWWTTAFDLAVAFE